MDDDLTTPNLAGIPVDDDAEPKNANVWHQASVEEVDEVDEMAQLDAATEADEGLEQGDDPQEVDIEDEDIEEDA